MNTCPKAAPDTVVTVIAAVPLLPSLVAVIVAVPTACAVTSPVALTVATAWLALAHVMVRPESGLPLASRGVAVSCTAPPVWSVCDAGDTVTVATGTGVTVMLAVPLLPSLVAVIVAEPAALPVTSPLALTVAIVVLLLAHVTTRPDSGVPLPSFGVATSCTVPLTGTLAVAGATSTDATATSVTVIAAVPLFPSLVAVSVAVPTACAVTSPLALTVATAWLSLAQVTTRPESGVPFASLGVAVSWTVAPMSTLAVAGLTLTVATGAGVVPPTLKLHTVWVPVPACSAQSASVVTALCSVRKAKPLPSVASAPPAGVT